MGFDSLSVFRGFSFGTCGALEKNTGGLSVLVVVVDASMGTRGRKVDCMGEMSRISLGISVWSCMLDAGGASVMENRIRLTDGSVSGRGLSVERDCSGMFVSVVSVYGGVVVSSSSLVTSSLSSSGDTEVLRRNVGSKLKGVRVAGAAVVVVVVVVVVLAVVVPAGMVVGISSVKFSSISRSSSMTVAGLVAKLCRLIEEYLKRERD